MKIAYIDENEADHTQFVLSAIQTKLFEAEMIDTIFPPKNISEIEDFISQNNVNALVVDFELRENSSGIFYTGLDVLVEIERNRKKFPCVAITSHLSKALEKKRESWRILDKKNVFISSAKQRLENNTNFFQRLKNDIDIYADDLRSAKDEHDQLYQKFIKNNDLNADEFQKLTDLDEFLEGAAIGDKKIPKHLKETNNFPFVKLINEVKELIEKIEQEKGGKS